MSRLVIAEKPSVAQSIASVLGAGEPKGRLSGRRRVSGELVFRPPGGAFGRLRL